MTPPLTREADADRLARVTLNLLVDPDDPGTADLVDELGAETVVTVLESDRYGRGEVQPPPQPRQMGVAP